MTNEKKKIPRSGSWGGVGGGGEGVEQGRSWGGGGARGGWRVLKDEVMRQKVG